LIKRCFKVKKPSVKLKNYSARLANLELKIPKDFWPTMVVPRVDSKSAELVYNVAPPLLNSLSRCYATIVLRLRFASA